MLSITTREAIRLPVAEGAKEMVTEQAVPGWKPEPEQESAVTVKSMASAPLKNTELMLSGAVPVLATLTLRLVDEPSVTDPKSRLAGSNVTDGKVPVPSRTTVRGLPGASLVTTIWPVRRPAACGLKTTLIVQKAPAARVEPQVGWLSRKSPSACMSPIASA